MNRKTLFYASAFEPSPLTKTSSPKVEISVLCTCMGVLRSMRWEIEVVVSLAGVSCVCLRNGSSYLNFSNTRILGLIVKFMLVSLKIYFSLF